MAIGSTFYLIRHW